MADVTPTPGAVWSWPDGRLSILSPDDIAPTVMCGGRGPDFCRKGASCRKHNACVYAGAPMTVKESDVIKTEVKMDIYEIDGKETHPVTGPKMTVRSVRPITARVDIVVGEHRYQVSRRDLESALAATAHTGER